MLPSRPPPTFGIENPRGSRPWGGVWSVGVGVGLVEVEEKKKMGSGW